ncbi:MAG: M12 family metallo-peptidase [Chitinophagales bacterium]
MKHCTTLLVLLLLCASYNVMAEKSKTTFFYGEPIAKEVYAHQKIDQELKDYAIFELNTERINAYVKNAYFNENLHLKLGDTYDWKLNLYENDIRAYNYLLREMGDERTSTLNRTENITYKGFETTDNGGEVRLSIKNDWFWGMVTADKTEWIIQPLTDFVSTANAKHFIVYDATDVIDSQSRTCAATAAHNLIGEVNIDEIATKQAVACQTLELAMAADKSMFNKKGSTSATADYLTSIVNLIQPNYTPFDLEFSIVEQVIITGTDPWDSSTNANTLLTSFCCWAGSGTSQQLGCTGANNFANTHDLGQLWSNRDFDGSTVGLAWTPGLCNSMFKYNCIQDFGGLQSMRVTSAHEIGHNLGAPHDDSNGFIMQPSVNSSATQFSPNSTSVIGSTVTSASCLSACENCFILTSIETTNCNPNTATYDLEIVIEHINTSGIVTLLIDGQFYVEDFGSSPQTIIISDLEANAAEGIEVTIQDSAAPSCIVDTFYDAPISICQCMVAASEDFNDCALPSGWTNNATGTTTSADWDFSTGTTDNPGNLDGTCMVHFDDDFFDGDGGEAMELISPSYDLSNYESADLSFDYNHQVYDGGAFTTDVWYNGSWINVLNETANACGAWGCNYPRAEININAYLSNDFKVRFAYTDAGGDGWQYYAAFDNFEVCGVPSSEPATCSTPTNHTEVAIGATTLTLGWDDVVAANSYEIAGRKQGGTWNTYPANTNPRSFSGLKANTTYEWGVRSVCAGGERSDWSSVRTFTTAAGKNNSQLADPFGDANSVLSMNIYPNPTKNTVNLSYSNPTENEVTIRIVDVVGRQVLVQQHTSSIENRLTLDISTLEKGYYFVEIDNGEANAIEKLMVW